MSVSRSGPLSIGEAERLVAILDDALTDALGRAQPSVVVSARREALQMAERILRTAQAAAEATS